MPPQSLAEFILYIIPGFIALQIYHQKYPAKERESLIVFAYSLVYGVLIISILKTIDKFCLNFILHSNSSGIPGTRFIIVIFFSAIFLGYLSILLRELRSYFSKKVGFLRWLSPGVDSIWQKINDPSNEDWAVIFLNDGSIYLGWISKYAFDPNNVDQDFLITQAKRVKEDLSTVYSVNGIGVYLNTREVKRIEFVRSRSKGE